ncbi:MAG: 3-isopropylmalate dehydratase small subunit [Candidatus Atribacteria bacterium]|nr:3-isopropylmalate dehydratase small subunit [Candidatus Atribacteria bacterium]MCD6349336.1 3-isopropylmalate dehydratase small subunit [Candidatus Atribacteria bacterium]
MKIKGKVIKYGDNVDTDVIIPARYLTTTDPQVLKEHCMEDLDPTFRERVTLQTILVAGKNFGCGSSREHAPLSIKASGVQAIIADSFARIFYRNAINIGLPIVEHPEATKTINEGDEVEIDFEKGEIVNLTTGKTLTIAPFPPFIQNIVREGGLMNYVKKKVAR